MLVIDPALGEKVEQSWVIVTPAESAMIRESRARIACLLSKGIAVRLRLPERNGVDRLFTLVFTDMNPEGVSDEVRGKIQALKKVLSDPTKVDPQVVIRIVASLPTEEIASSDSEE